MCRMVVIPEKTLIQNFHKKAIFSSKIEKSSMVNLIKDRRPKSSLSTMAAGDLGGAGGGC